MKNIIRLKGAMQKMDSTPRKSPELRIRKFSNVYIGTGNGLLKKNIN